MKKSVIGFIAASIFAMSIPAIAAEGDDAAPSSDESQAVTPTDGGEQAAPSEHGAAAVIEFLSR
jgi:hypothetical protein